MKSKPIKQGDHVDKFPILASSHPRSEKQIIEDVIDTIIRYAHISPDSRFTDMGYFITLGDVPLNNSGFSNKDEAQEFLQECLVPFLEDVKKGDAAWARFFQKHKQDKEDAKL